MTERVLSPRPAGVAEVRPQTERGRGPEGEGQGALARARWRAEGNGRLNASYPRLAPGSTGPVRAVLGSHGLMCCQVT